MRTEHALRLAGVMKRYDGRGGTRGKWNNSSGSYVPNVVLPMVPKRVNSAVQAIMEGDALYERFECVTMMVDPHDVWTFQWSLRYRSLVYHIRNFDKTQKHVDYARGPTMFLWGGKYVVWNGNHRTTAALLLGRKIKCRVFRKRKRRLKRRAP